jgi:integrase
MVLSMPSPYKHKATGIYWFKQRVPARLTAVARGRSVMVTVDEVPSMVKLGEYLKVSLRTKDPSEAKRRGNDAQSQFDLIWQSLTDAPARLTHRQIVALAGEVYHMFKAAEDDPGDAERWSKAVEINSRVMAGQTLFIGRDFGLEKRFGPFVDLALAKHTLRVDEDTRQKLLEQTAIAMQDATTLLIRRAGGDYGPDAVEQRFPAVEIARPLKTIRAAQVPIGDDPSTLTGLLAHKQRTQTKKSDTFDKYRGCLKDFVAFVGHEEVSRITKDDARRWRDALIKRGLAKKTINDQYLTSLKVALNHGVKEFDLPLNVAANIRDERDAPAPSGSKGYSAEQATAILQATFRGSTKDLALPYQRAIFWVPWICAYTGLRVTEVTQFQGRHLRVENGIPYLLITPEDGSTKGKNAWTTGVHSHLIDLGLLDMFRAVGDGPAFYTPYPDGTDLKSLSDHRAKSAGDKIAEWVRDEVGIAAPGNRPSHAWRHAFTTLSRTHRMDKEARDYMMGSRSQTDAREGYGDWSPEVVDAEINKLPRFEVSATDWRPSIEAVAPQPLKNAQPARPSRRTRKSRITRA